MAFLKGHTPWNKGQRCSYLIGNTNGFEIGNIPWNKEKRYKINKESIIKSRPKECEFCHKIFYITSNRLNSKNRFCDRNCQKQYNQSQKVLVQCNCCNKEFFIIPYWAKKLKQHFCSQECKWKILTNGKNNPTFNNWSSFKGYDINFNKKFKNLVRKRDNQVCMLCNVHREKLNRALDIHHINYDKKLSIPENCISLCKSCHPKTNVNRKYWVTFFQSLLLERYGYNYSENKIVLEIKKCQ